MLVDVALFSFFLQTFIWEKENRDWLEEHFSTDSVRAFYNNKELKEKFERRFMDVIGKLKKYKEEETDPSHQDVQVTLKEFFNLIEGVTNYLDIPQSDIENIIQKSNFSLSEFPTLFTTEEENYIKEAIKQFNT
ncbi:MerR family transcriptional regulator [Bacillus cereus]|nr:MerR family transcriptional regulator [Bacillus cereus]